MAKYGDEELRLMAQAVIQSEAEGDPRAIEFYKELAARIGVSPAEARVRTDLMATFGNVTFYVNY